MKKLQFHFIFKKTCTRAIEDYFFMGKTKRWKKESYLSWSKSKLRKKSPRYEKNSYFEFIRKMYAIFFKKRVLAQNNIFFFWVQPKGTRRRLFKNDQSQNRKTALWSTKKVQKTNVWNVAFGNKINFFFFKFTNKSSVSWWKLTFR